MTTSNMTISQALRRVKKLKGDLAEVLSRATASVSYAVGNEPAFNFGACVEEASLLRAELLELKNAVAVANATTKIEWNGVSQTISHAVGVLSEIKSQIAWMKVLSVKARDEVVVEETTFDYESSKHITKKTQWRCALPEAKRAEQIQKLQSDFDKLNDLVETTNHKTVIRSS